MSGDTANEPPDIFGVTRRLWNRWLGDLGLVLDGYMRSALFLEWMKYGIKAMSETRKFHAQGLARRGDEREQDSSVTTNFSR